MQEIRFTHDHEWIRLDNETATVGISDYAQTQLGDVVFVELPPVGRRVAKGEQAAVVESVKAAAEVFSPAAGEVVAVNAKLNDDPALVNRDPFGEGWFFKIKLANRAELETLMSEPAYRTFVGGLG
jgi:glycine cleavage system H protein